MSTSCHRLTLSLKLLIFPHKSKISDVPAGCERRGIHQTKCFKDEFLTPPRKKYSQVICDLWQGDPVLLVVEDSPLKDNSF